MKTMSVLYFVFFSFFLINTLNAQPGEKRIQYMPGLKNAYFGINLGYIQYPFSSAQLEPGFTVESVTIPHVAPRLVLYGYELNKYVAAQITYMRPVQWVKYNNINGNQMGHTVWMNVGGLTVVGKIPLARKLSVALEAGLGVITRKGFRFNNTEVVKNTVYATGLFGAALQYHINNKWDLQFGSAFSPAHQKEKQPRTVFLGLGFNYHLRELTPERISAVQRSGYIFPKQLLQAGYTTNVFGYGINNLFSQTLPVFWGGAAQLKRGLTVNYQRNIFHSRKVFSLDVGAGTGIWKSNKKEESFFTASIYPVLRFIPIRTSRTDLFFEYTVAGPTFISRTLIDNEKTGRRFTFYDAMGVGLFTGKNRNLNAGIRIAHFSNGNIFPNNNGVKVPLTFSLGYAWK